MPEKPNPEITELVNLIGRHINEDDAPLRIRLEPAFKETRNGYQRAVAVIGDERAGYEYAQDPKKVIGALTEYHPRQVQVDGQILQKRAEPDEDRPDFQVTFETEQLDLVPELDDANPFPTQNQYGCRNPRIIAWGLSFRYRHSNVTSRNDEMLVRFLTAPDPNRSKHQNYFQRISATVAPLYRLSEEAARACRYHEKNGLPHVALTPVAESELRTQGDQAVQAVKNLMREQRGVTDPQECESWLEAKGRLHGHSAKENVNIDIKDGACPVTVDFETQPTEHSVARALYRQETAPLVPVGWQQGTAAVCLESFTLRRDGQEDETIKKESWQFSAGSENGVHVVDGISLKVRVRGGNQDGASYDVPADILLTGDTGDVCVYLSREYADTTGNLADLIHQMGLDHHGKDEIAPETFEAQCTIIATRLTVGEHGAFVRELQDLADAFRPQSKPDGETVQVTSGNSIITWQRRPTK